MQGVRQARSGALGAPGTATERKSPAQVAPRLSLSLPGVFMGVHGNFDCIITNLWRDGVIIALREDIKVGDEGYLRSGPINHFMVVSRSDYGRHTLEFEEPVDDRFVKEMRNWQASLEDREREALLQTVRSWSTGEDAGRL